MEATKLIIPFFRNQLGGKKFAACIDITNRCNLSCRHCHHYRERQQEENIPLKEWKQRFASLKRQGYVYAMFLGGEPTLRMDALLEAGRYFPFYSTFTNGQIRIPKDFQGRIQLSLDGLREDHDYIRGKGVFDRAVNNYSGDKRVIVNCILSRMNYAGPDKLQRFIDYVRQMGVSGLVMDFFIPREHMSDDESHCLNEAELQEVREVLAKELERPDNILFATYDLLVFQTAAKSQLKDCSMMQSMAKVTADYKIQDRLCGDSDCSRCRSIRKYDVPVYDFRNWLAFKKVSYKWMFL